MGATLATSRGSQFQETGRTAGPCVMVLFGGAGDLTKRKLVPALFNLVKANLLPKDFAVLGFSVDELSLEQFRNQVTRFLQASDRGTDAWEWFMQRLHYARGDFADPDAFKTLCNRLGELDAS